MQWGTAKKERAFWPAQTMLLILSPEILLKAAKGESGDPREQFLTNLKKQLKGGKLADVAAVCYVDICKASTFVSKSDTSALRFLVPDAEIELKDRLFNQTQLFKNSEGNVDEPIMVDCLVSLFMLSSRKVSNSLFQEFFEGSSPNASLFKRVLLKTLVRIAKEGASLPWNPTIQDIYQTHAGNLRKLFQEFKKSGPQFLEARATAATAGKKGERQLEKATMDLDILITTLELFATVPELALFPANTDAPTEIKDLLIGISDCISVFEISELHENAVRALLVLHRSENVLRWNAKTPSDAFWKISSAVNYQFGFYLGNNQQMQPHEVKKIITILHDLLESRLQFLEANPTIIPSAQNKVQRYQTSSILETTLLIHLCSAEPEIVSLCAQCFGLLCAEVDHLRRYINTSDNAIIDNFEAYQQLSTAANVSTGRQAQQKAIRNILRLVEKQTEGNYAAWLGVHERWKLYSQAIARNEEIQAEEAALKEEATKGAKRNKKAAEIRKDDDREAKYAHLPKTLIEKKPMEVQVEWNNYLGFLCSLAAVSKDREQTIKQVDKKTKAIVEKKVLMLEDFIQNLMEDLVHDLVPIRSSVTLSLGNALSPAAYPTLFKFILQEISTKIFRTSSQIEMSEGSVLFMDQVISVIKLIIETNSDPDALAKLSDIEDLVITIIKFVRQLVFSGDSLQTKHKCASLIEALISKKAYIPFRNENKFRSQLVESIMEWTSEFSKEATLAADTSQSEERRIKKLQQDLDLQVMQCISSLLKGLPLQGKDDEAKSEAFSKLFTFFSRLLSRCKEDPTTVNSLLPEVTIEALSCLVAANIDHGLEYFVSMGYHENYETRSAFLTVMSNILKQGTEFEMSDEAGADKYYKLTELILDTNLETVLTLCDVTPITEADAIAQLVVRVFEANQRVMDLIKASISYEVSKTEKANTLFRLNSMATKIMVQYCKLIGVDYLRASVGPEIRAIVANPKPMEMDPEKLPPGQNITENTNNVRESAEKFLNDIKNSIPECPLAFREICTFLKDTVGAKFPDAEHTAIAGFMFLRFMCPAIIAPDGFQVISTTVTDKDTRRALVLVTKVLQNLANRVHFVKEPFMECMNSYIDDNLEVIKGMFDLYAVTPESAPSPEVSFSDEQKQTDMGTLHYFLFQSRDKLQKAYAENPSNQSNWFEKLSLILSQLGEPPQPSNKKAEAQPRYASGDKQNAAYEEFMKKNAKTETDFLKSKNIYFVNGKTKKATPTAYYIARNLSQTIDITTLFYFMLKTTQPLFSKPYSIVIDLTMFSIDNIISPVHVATLAKILPNEACENLQTVYLLHPNTNFKKYIKRISKHIGRAVKKIVVCSFLHQLFDEIKENECGIPESTLEIQSDVQSTFTQVTKVMFNKKAEVELKFSKDVVQIISSKRHPILNSSAQLLDFIHISDIIEVSAGSKEEAILKVDNQGQKIITFMTKAASQIVQQLNDSRERYKLTRPQNTLARKSFQPSDVPGTLLNMALLNMTANNPSLRIAAYNLLSAACQSFSFNMDSHLLAGSNLALGRNCMNFVSRVSSELANAEPRLTLEFVLEALHGITKADKISQIYVLQYISPWLYNLKYFSNITSAADSADKYAKTRDLVNSLIALTIRESRENMPLVLSNIWKPIATTVEALDVTLACIIERSIPSSKSSPLGTKNMDCLEDIIITLATENSQIIAGKIIKTALDTIRAPSSQPIDKLESHDQWVKIEIFLRWIMILSYENLLCIEQFLPDLFHIIILTSGSGDSMLRTNVHALFMNLVHAVFTSRICHKDKLQTLRSNLNEFQSVSSRLQFGISAGGKNFSPFLNASERDSNNIKLEKPNIATNEYVAKALLLVMNCCTERVTAVGTAQHARWLSLITLDAFSHNLALQPRAIIALGVLSAAPSLVSHQLFSQVLGVLKDCLQRKDGQIDNLCLASVNCLSHLYEYLSPWSHYFKVFFWIAIGLLQIPDWGLFGATLPLLEAIVKTLNETGHFKEGGMSSFCLGARKGRLESLIQQIDTSNGISFDTNFSFSLATLLLKGLKNSTYKNVTVRTLSSILRLCSETEGSKMLGYFSALLPINGDDDVELQGMFVFLFHLPFLFSIIHPPFLIVDCKP